MEAIIVPPVRSKLNHIDTQRRTGKLEFVCVCVSVCVCVECVCVWCVCVCVCVCVEWMSTHSPSPPNNPHTYTLTHSLTLRQVNPAKRASAAEAMQHPWISHNYARKRP